MGKTPEELTKEKEQLQEVLTNLENSYRTAKISEQNYNDVKTSTQKKLDEIEKELSAGDAPAGDKKAAAPASDDNMAGDFTSETADAMKEEIDPATLTGMSSGAKADSNVEMEKLRVLIETSRDEMKTLQETIRSISENVGEVRSMAFQSEGLVKEMEIKLQKLQDDVAEIKPSEITKKMKKFEESVEKIDLFDEKADTKFADLSKKANMIYDMMKSAGGIENMASLNSDITKRANEVKDAMHYIERLASKAEKSFLEINKNLEDFHVYKTRQDTLEESVKEIIKSLDETNLRMENLATKKELSNTNTDILFIKKQIGEINRVIPLVKVRLPEQIQKLSKEKDEVSAMLDLIDGQVKGGAISEGEYEKLKKINEAKLKFLTNQLEEEWRRFERLAESGELNVEEAPIPMPPIPETAPSPAPVAAQPVAPSPASNAPQPTTQEAPAVSPAPSAEPQKRKRGRPKKVKEEPKKEPDTKIIAEENRVPEDMRKMIEDAFEKSPKTEELKETFENPKTRDLYKEEKKEEKPAEAKPDENKAKPEDKASVDKPKENSASLSPASNEAKSNAASPAVSNTPTQVLPPTTEKPDDIDKFVNDVAKKYLGDKEKEEFMKKVENKDESKKEEPKRDEPAKEEKKKEEKKPDEKKKKESTKAFESASKIKEMM